MSITTVIFDFGYVLSLPPRASDYQNLAKLAGIDGNAFDEIYWSQRADYDWGTIDGPAFGIASQQRRAWKLRLLKSPASSPLTLTSGCAPTPS
jgi:hypothetical protein